MSMLFYPRKLRTGALLLFGPLCMVFAGFGISNADAAATSPISNVAAVVIAVGTATAHTSKFCTFAESASKTNTSSAAAETPATLSAAYAKLKSEEPVILAAAPSQIKGDFQTLFNYFNKFYGELASVKYNYLQLTPSYLEGLAKAIVPVETASKAIEAYLVKTCGISAK